MTTFSIGLKQTCLPLWIGLLWNVLFLLTPVANAQTSNITNSRVPWLVVSENIKGLIELCCTDPDFYPFQDISKAIQVGWQLPAAFKSKNLLPGETYLGFEVLQDSFSLMIDRAKFPKGTDIAGAYKCMALAKTIENDELTTWYFLRWGVDIFASESMLLDTVPTIKYRRNIIGGVAAPLVILLTAALLKLFTYLRQRRKRSEELVIPTGIQSVHVYSNKPSNYNVSNQNGRADNQRSDDIQLQRVNSIRISQDLDSSK